MADAPPPLPLPCRTFRTVTPIAPLRAVSVEAPASKRVTLKDAPPPPSALPGHMFDDPSEAPPAPPATDKVAIQPLSGACQDDPATDPKLTRKIEPNGKTGNRGKAGD
jgi:hypothetical protein